MPTTESAATAPTVNAPQTAATGVAGENTIITRELRKHRRLRRRDLALAGGCPEFRGTSVAAR